MPDTLVYLEDQQKVGVHSAVICAPSHHSRSLGPPQLLAVSLNHVLATQRRTRVIAF